MAKRLTILLLYSIISFGLFGQEFGNLRKKIVAISTDTLSLDSLSIIPGSFAAFDILGNSIDTALYHISYGKAELYTSSKLRAIHKNMVVEYRVFPLLFERVYYKRDYKMHLSPDSLMGREPPHFIIGQAQEPLLGEQFQTNGSIMRGIRFGNSQNLSVNSSMNLTFQGELSNNLMIEGAISDQAIPMQPEGTTRRLEEFDRIYIRVHRKDFSVQAGDIELQAGGLGQLLTFKRNVQGLAYNGRVSKEKDTLEVMAAISIPKGKFSRNQLQGSEGNQGPYRLKGASGEPFIIILSGSEKVYVDGILLTRGDDQHYTIDYNAAEVTFTQRMPINRNSRIQVEFEYSERSYSRFTTFGSVHSRSKKWQWNLSVFSEQDSRNQPFDQELTSEQKKHLASIGDNLDQAYFSQVDKVDFDPEKILYQQLDTVVTGVSYTVFKHSINPLLAQYRVYFTFVGQGSGNYTPDFGTANGRVYRWVAPQGTDLQGSYEPIRRLVTPQSRQMVQAGLTRLWGRNSHITANYALTNTDLNTFSNLNSDDDIGHGIQLSFAHNLAPSAKDYQVAIGADIMKTTQGFRSIDRFRPVEFERNWSITTPLTGANEQMMSAWAELKNRKRMYTKVTAQQLSISDSYMGNRIGFTGWGNTMGIVANWDASLVTASDTSVASQFYKAKAGVKHTQKFINLEVAGEMESSLANSMITDSLLAHSFSWYQLKALISTPDSLPVQTNVWYVYRNDYKPLENQVKRLGTSQEVALSTSVNKDKAGNLSVSLGYRIYRPSTTLFPNTIKEAKTALARMEYSNRVFKGLWTVAGSYELGSGLEPDMEYYFVEVPAGQGVYTWVDYNKNGIMELAEFEIANYPDEARFIRINIPGAKMISVRNNAISLRSNLTPAVVLKGKKGILKQFALLSNQTSFKVQQKNQTNDFWQSANPIITNPSDTQIVSMNSHIRNSLAYNRASRRFGAEYTYLQAVSKTILANGFEQKEIQSNRVVVWLGLGSNITCRTEAEDYSNVAKSQYFTMRNYNIQGQNAQQSVKYISSMHHTVEVSYKWNQSHNTMGSEDLRSHSLVLQADFAFAGKGSIMSKISYVTNAFEGNQQSAVAYEMMRGLQAGKNVIWEISVRKRLSKLFELELGYNGRYLNDGSVVHSGSMQARALF